MQEVLNPNGVVIPQETITESNNKKTKAKKTLPQLPAYRTAANLKFIVTSLLANCPKKLMKLFDQMLGTASEIKKSIGMASISRNPEERAWYLECARVLAQDLSDDFTALRRLEMPLKESDGKVRRFPIVGKDLDNKVKSLVKSLISQLVAWRDYTMNEGANALTDSQKELK